MKKRKKMRPGRTLKALLTREALRGLAGDRFFGRGEEYAGWDAAKLVEATEHKITAKVHGSRGDSYRVIIEAGPHGLGGECSCPAYDQYGYCKHFVAAGLTWLRDGSPVTAKRADWRPAVRRLAAKELAELLLAAAANHEDVAEKLRLRVMKQSPPKQQEQELRAVIDEVFGEWIEDRHEASERCEAVVKTIKQLVRGPHAGLARGLIEYARGVYEAFARDGAHSDDAGSMAMEELLALHPAACRAAKTPPRELAQLLFTWRTQESVFENRDLPERYARALGSDGRAAYAELVREAWAKAPPAIAALEYKQRRYWQILRGEMRALLTNDPDAQVALFARELADESAYLTIVEILRGARRHREAMEWAEKGFRALPRSRELSNWLREHYHSQKRYAEALAIAWNDYRQDPGRELFRRLKHHALPLEQWPEWRDKAIERARMALANQSDDTIGRKMLAAELVNIYRDEGDVDAAWAIADEYGCADSCRLALARDKRLPAYRAVRAYRQLIEPTIEQKGNAAYDEAMTLLKEMRQRVAACGQEKEFAEYVAGLRERHRPKRNFIALLAQLDDKDGR